MLPDTVLSLYTLPLNVASGVVNAFIAGLIAVSDKATLGVPFPCGAGLVSLIGDSPGLIFHLISFVRNFVLTVILETGAELITACFRVFTIGFDIFFCTVTDYEMSVMAGSVADVSSPVTDNMALPSSH